uniref:G-protein coupled receptors family 1 profile domain-containing protein n=1 Tax=Romanomermis culicivorax TaxID=13658 RepID=A0A915HVY3_ROMCU
MSNEMIIQSTDELNETFNRIAIDQISTNDNLETDIVWIVSCSINFVGSLVTCLVLTTWKNIHSATITLLAALMVSEMTSAGFLIFFNFWHMYYTVTKESELMTARRCSFLAGLQYIPSCASWALSLAIAIDRLNAVFRQAKYQELTKWSVRVKISVAVVWGLLYYIIMVSCTPNTYLLTVCSGRLLYFDDYKVKNFLVILTTTNTCTTIVIYLFILVVVRFKASKWVEPKSTASDNNNLAAVKKIRSQQLTKALTFTCLSYASTTIIEKTVGLFFITFAPDLQYRVGVYVGTLGTLEGVNTFVGCCLFMTEFRKGLKNLVDVASKKMCNQ